MLNTNVPPYHSLAHSDHNNPGKILKRVWRHSNRLSEPCPLPILPLEEFRASKPSKLLQLLAKYTLKTAPPPTVRTDNWETTEAAILTGARTIALSAPYLKRTHLKVVTTATSLGCVKQTMERHRMEVKVCCGKDNLTTAVENCHHFFTQLIKGANDDVTVWEHH